MYSTLSTFITHCHVLCFVYSITVHENGLWNSLFVIQLPCRHTLWLSRDHAISSTTTSQHREGSLTQQRYTPLLLQMSMCKFVWTRTDLFTLGKLSTLLLVCQVRWWFPRTCMCFCALVSSPHVVVVYHVSAYGVSCDRHWLFAW